MVHCQIARHNKNVYFINNIYATMHFSLFITCQLAKIQQKL